MKVLTVEEALAEMKAKTKNGKTIVNRFNKKNFTKLLTALANDVEFTTEVAKIKKGDLDTVEEIMVSKEFRKWCKSLLEKAGMDKSESVKILDKSFIIPSMDGMYEFFATALYEYMGAGNQFEFLPKKDFNGKIYLKDVDDKTTITDAHSPQDRSYLGTYETKKKKHKEVASKSSCPSWLQERKKIK